MEKRNARKKAVAAKKGKKGAPKTSVTEIAYEEDNDGQKPG